MTKPNTLYLSYTGLLEPLGKSQILSYLKRLSEDYSITLVTFEKESDFELKDNVKALKILCDEFGINWQPRLYHKNPRLLATLWDIWILLLDTVRFSSDVELIHCRNYIPAIAAWFVGLFTRVPFVFDMRALWIEELIEAKSIKRYSIYHKLISWFEVKLLKHASQVVTLTEAVIPHLVGKYVWLDTTKFTVIPTCVDLDKFSVVSFTEKKKFLTVGTMGTVVSGRYQLNSMIRLFSALEKRWPKLTFKIVTKDNEDVIKNVCRVNGFNCEKLTIFPSDPADIAENIADLDLAVVLFTPGLSTLGSSPTRIGEFLACGIPVVVNTDVGDTANIVSNYGVGVVLKENEDIEILLDKIDQLVNDSDIEKRCRQLSESVLSADVGAKQYSNVYKKVINGRILEEKQN
jgi:glycosyltransferase involved in cell wall biosynthesis